MRNDSVAKEFVLVHGAWHGSWCWEYVIPKLEALGHAVHAPDLPSVDRNTAYKRITLTSYVDTVARSVENCRRPPIVVGHSMAGMIITQLGEQIPDRIAALVYLAAFLPSDGESLADLAARDTDSIVTRHRVIDEVGSTMNLPPEVLREAFYGRCSEEDASNAIARLHPEPLAPSAASVSTSRERFGRVPKTYIECAHDQAVTPSMQRIMCNNAACERVLELSSDHSPFYSTVDELVECLDQVIVD